MKRTLVLLLTALIMILFTACVASDNETAYYVPQSSVNPNDHTVTIQAKSADIDMRNTLVAEGVGELSIMPDVAYIKIGASATSKSESEAEKETKNIIDQIKSELGMIGIKAEDIRFLEQNIIPVKGEEADYEVRNYIEIRLKNIARTGDVLERSREAGANLDAQVRYDIEDKEETESRVLALALGNAVSKAKIMAEAAGVELLDVMLVSQEIIDRTEDVLAVSEETEIPVIFAMKEISVLAKVRITYEIKTLPPVADES